MDRDLFDAVQVKLNEQVTNYKASHMKSEALLLGRIFDDRGHRMTPSHARKRGIKYRYYISSALLHGQTKHAGTVNRIPAVAFLLQRFRLGTRSYITIGVIFDAAKVSQTGRMDAGTCSHLEGPGKKKDFGGEDRQNAKAN